MTNEEAITELHYILNHKVFGDARLVGAVKRAIQALEQIDEIIKALEQQPCEDCISDKRRKLDE